MHLVEQNKNMHIVGIDLSKNALKKASEKASLLNKEIELIVMDVRRLEFLDNSYDKIICIHVMDFLDDVKDATKEMIRVLKEKGEFVITYPSQKEGWQLGHKILRENVSYKLSVGTNRIRAVIDSVYHLAAGIIYLPLMLRKKRVIARDELSGVISGLTSNFNIEEYPEYCDFIVYGSKLTR